ncbi:hypothetical protein [Myxococcus vastator]|uniref:hypothetical protein n=1 Tax=Myxococcus vastator TaxID=2709664 RepID=UPI0013D50471|nr:hypothetical protein [Myxococcus vastator]
MPESVRRYRHPSNPARHVVGRTVTENTSMTRLELMRPATSMAINQPDYPTINKDARQHSRPTCLLAAMTFSRFSWSENRGADQPLRRP